jgi:hypothetical protein
MHMMDSAAMVQGSITSNDNVCTIVSLSLLNKPSLKLNAPPGDQDFLACNTTLHRMAQRYRLEVIV